jgi:hypothetical protein
MDQRLLLHYLDMRRLVVIAGLVALAGCVTPSIPIPPPDPARMNFDVTVDGSGNSSAVFTYPAEVNYQNALVYVFNRDRGTGIIETAHADGSVGPTTPVGAAVGEQVVVTFERDDQTVSSCVRLREGAQSATDYCSP